MTQAEIAGTEVIADYMNNGVVPKYHPTMKYFDWNQYREGIITKAYQKKKL